MSRIATLAAELVLLPNANFISAFWRAIAEQRKQLVALGLNEEDAAICAQSIVAAAVMRAKRLEEGSAQGAQIELGALGFSMD